jgi:hypothetical protein
LDKEDGSLMNLWKYRDKLYCSTRFSFASHPIGVGLDTWENYFFSCLNLDGANEVMHDYGEYPITLSFEFCSPYNKVVRSYATPQVFLLAAHDNWILSEISDSYVNDFALMLNVSRPRLHRFANVQEVQSFIEVEASRDATFEGVVVKDDKNHRLKIKNAKYLSLHRARGNGDAIFLPKNLIPFVVGEGDETELITYFPEVIPSLNKIKDKYQKTLKNLENYWYCYWDEKSQRKFAENIKGCVLPSILFLARKSGNDLKVELKSKKAKEIMTKFLIQECSK